MRRISVIRILLVKVGESATSALDGREFGLANLQVLQGKAMASTLYISGRICFGFSGNQLVYICGNWEDLVL